MRRDLWVLHLPPKITIPRKSPAGSPASRTSCRRARVKHAGSVAGRRRAGCSGALLCIPVGSAGWQDRAHFERVRERARGWASLQRARVGKTSECIRCRAGNPPCAAGSAQRAPAPPAVPTESRGGLGAPESLRSVPLSLKEGIKSNQKKKKKSHHVFSKEKIGRAHV